MNGLLQRSMMAFGMLMAPALAGCLGDSAPDGEACSLDGPRPATLLEMSQPDGRLVVREAEDGADWCRLTIEITQCEQKQGVGATGRLGTTDPYVNVPATERGGPLNAAVRSGWSCGQGHAVPVAEDSRPMQRDDYVEFCSSPPEADMRDIVIVVRDAGTGKEMAEFVFPTWRDC